MIVVKEFKNDEYIYDNILNSNDLTIVNIVVNGENIIFDYKWLIDTQFTAGNIGLELDALKNKLELGLFAKAPCGGFINFYKTQGSKGNYYVIFSGVNEVSNSHYIVTIHKIIDYNSWREGM